ncbi:MAG: acyl-CoA synthetase FdrA [Ardenticatenales bacterium]|nr:acyl-CoA synthetase FdrA [Ardenticatenales bacterium]
MSATQFEIRAGAYFDSVILMQLQKALAALPGVEDAGVVMATPANRDVLLSTGFDLAGIEAKADDLLIIVNGADDAAAQAAIGQVDSLLQRRRATTAQDFRPRSLAAAARNLPAADWVLISVPGRYAAEVADEALELGKHVFLYSDNVSLDDEIKLKTKAAERGLLVMGPDCGTAIINGIGLGFANRVRRGNIGVVAASGTGLQAVTVGVHRRDGGVSQAFGTGGRDLKAEVGGRTALQALAYLAADEATSVICLISKPPSAEVAARLLTAARQVSKPVVVNFIGFAPPARQLGNLHFALTLDEAAELAVGLAGDVSAVAEQPEPLNGYLRGLFSGGTLAYEMVLGLQSFLPLKTNVPIRPDQKLADVWHSEGHTIIDMGEDDFTQGRLHPMMDNDLRLRRLRQEAADPETGLILLDVVLGEGAHPDPAAELAPAIAAVDKPVVVLLLGTPEDPQGLAYHVEAFAAAGATVVPDTNGAVAHVLDRLPAAAETGAPVTFGKELVAINVGLESFRDSLTGQGATSVQVDWRPPAGGNEKMMDILARLKSPSRRS